jgi:hypothetical protein
VPDLVAIRVKSPESGATMRASGDVVTCTYCGTESRVQRRTQLFQRPIDLPPIGPSQPRTVALQRSNTARWIALGSLLAVAALASVVFTANLASGPQALPPLPNPGSAPIWTTSHPLLVDLDRDGFEDAIGLVRTLQPPVLVAFDRERGTRMFETILQRKASWYLTGIALEVGPTAVWIAIDDGVRAYDRTTGALRWHMAN